MKCISCKKGYRNLTEERLCFFCHKSKYGTMAKEFQPRGKYKG